MSKYSIITPVYNSFSAMERYFESLEKQSFKDFEILLIDDCSNDGSYEMIVEKIKKLLLNIKIYRTDANLGPGNARNIGISHATGEWITFIDNDDWVDSDFLESIDFIVNNNDVDCVIFDYYIAKSDGNIKPAKSMYKGTTGMVSLADCVMFARNHSIGKVYKREKCANIAFPKLRRCEDVAYVDRAIVGCGKVYYINKPFYYYYQRPNSLSNNTKLDESDMIKAFSILETHLSSIFPKEIEEKSVTDLLYGSVLMMCKSKKSNKEIADFIIWYEKKYPSWSRCKIIKLLGKGKRIFLWCIKHRFFLFLKIITKVHTKLIG